MKEEYMCGLIKMTSKSKKTALISGITGQDGAYLSRHLLRLGYDIVGLSRASEPNLYRLKYLQIDDNIKVIQCNLLDYSSVVEVLKEYKPNEVYNLSAQSSVGKSFLIPHETLYSNIISVLNILEAVKIVNKSIKVYQASSSEMFGNIVKLPVSETSGLHPVSPYGISKASAHWTAVHYRESYGIFVCSGILFNHESYLRPENYLIKKIIKTAIAIYKGEESRLVVGNIELHRDFGYAPDYVIAMWQMLQQDKPEDYVISSGVPVLLKDIIVYVFNYFGISTEKIHVDKSLYRPNDISIIYGDSSKARNNLGWTYNKSFYAVLNHLLDEELQNDI